MSYATKRFTYQYNAFNFEGKRITDSVEAISIDQAQALLAQQTLTLISIKKKSFLFARKKAITKKALLTFTMHLQQAIAAHLPLPAILKLLYHKEANKPFKQILHQLQLTIEQGHTLSYAMTQVGNYFPQDYIAFICAGETHGNLSQALTDAQAVLEAHCTLIQALKKALTYPIIVLTLATLITAAMILFVVPQFTTMYAQMGSQLPWPTVLLLRITALSVRIIPMIATLSIILCGIAQYYWRHNAHFQMTLQKKLLRLPLWGAIIRQKNTIRWLSIVGTQIQAGIHLTHAMRNAHQALNHRYFQNQLTLCALNIDQGALLSKSLSSIDFIHEHVLTFIEMGEQNGQLGAALTQQARQLQQDLMQRLEQATRLLEPLIMVILAIVLGSILIVLYLPLFNLGQLF